MFLNQTSDLLEKLDCIDRIFRNNVADRLVINDTENY